MLTGTYNNLKIWLERSRNITLDNVIDMYRSPCVFQVEISKYLNDMFRKHNGKRSISICELGCEFGITSLLLSSDIFQRHCLDLNQYSINLLKQAATLLGEEIDLYVEDMFSTQFNENTFDIVFNSGVLEHYSFEERILALRECARIVKPGGLVLIGVPNHFSIPYRFAYLIRISIKKWPYPPEEKIKDFSEEIRVIESLYTVRTLLFDKETVFNVIPRSNYASLPFRLLDNIFNFEPYLRVIELKKHCYK